MHGLDGGLRFIIQVSFPLLNFWESPSHCKVGARECFSGEKQLGSNCAYTPPSALAVRNM